MMENIPFELKENDSKFIQIYMCNEPYLIFAPKKSGFYHGFMLEEILTDEGIVFEKFEDKSLSSEIPLAKGKDYEIVGAGKASRLPGERMKFYDSSGSYHIGTNLKHLEEVFKDKESSVEKISIYQYIVHFNKSQEDRTEKSSFSIKSNLNEEGDFGTPF